MSRIDFYGIAYFHILILVILFKQKSIFIKNISLICCLILIHICAVSDFYALKTMKMGFDAEKMQWNRIINRIETAPNYNDNKDYRLVILGTSHAYRPYFYDDYDDKYPGEPALLNFPYMTGWGTGQVLVFHAFTKHSRDGKWTQISYDWSPDLFKEIVTAMPEEIQNAEAWPSMSSIFVKDDILFIALDQAELDKVKQMIKLD
jgi:hypothetical protein